MAHRECVNGKQSRKNTLGEDWKPKMSLEGIKLYFTRQAKALMISEQGNGSMGKELSSWCGWSLVATLSTM